MDVPGEFVASSRGLVCWSLPFALGALGFGAVGPIAGEFSFGGFKSLRCAHVLPLAFQVAWLRDGKLLLGRWQPGALSRRCKELPWEERQRQASMERQWEPLQVLGLSLLVGPRSWRKGRSALAVQGVVATCSA